MEKNKGLFSFRKHPVGDFPDGKKGRKRKGGRLRRSMGFLMAAVLIFNTLPASGLAVSASEQEKGLCEHHTEHTAECGYAEAQPCTHEHGEECYKTVTECVHEHTDECYPETEATEESTGEGSATDYGAEGREPENCTHVCSEESGCITKVLDCHHEHDENCGYQEAQDCGYVCEICNGTELEDTENNAENDAENAGTDTAECICETLCTEDSINGDCPVCGADDASFLDCKGKVPEENTENQEDTGICKHHQEHDADCGYIPKSEDGEGSPCTYECRVCPIEDLIAALPEQVTEDNADDVRGQLDHILDLYRELDEGEQEEIDLSRVTKLQEALDAANAPMAVAGEININSTRTNILTAEAGGCPGHTFTGTTAMEARIYVESGVHNVTFSGLNITAAAKVGVAPGATMNLTIEGTNTIKAGGNAGIYVPKDATLVITDGNTGTLEVSSSTDAGIGGAVYAPDGVSDGDPNCGTVIINGGTITATGGKACAGIGGGSDASYNPGNGGTVIINGGTVTATGGSDGSCGGAGIGGSAGASASDPAGNGGTLTINGGHVTLTPGAYGTDWGAAYGFGQGSGSAPGGTCELTLADASYLDSGTTLDPKGKYTINGDPTADMIVVPKLVYTGEALDTSGIKIDDSKTGTGTYFGQTFTVKASAEGWVLQELGEVKAAGEYTAVFKKGEKEIRKTFTVAKSGTDLTSEGKVKTYNGETATDSFTASDIITVKATPTATGTAPQKAAARLRGSYTAPTAGQMALFVGDIQVCEPVEAGADGTYTMTVSAADVLTKGQAGQDDKYTLIVKFVENTNMAGAEAQVEITITPNPLTADMVTLSAESGTYSGTEQKPTVTVTGLTEGTDYEITYTGNFTSAGEHTLTVTGKGIYRGTVEKTYTIGKATPTIAWNPIDVETIYTGQPADVKPVVTLVNGETYTGEIHYSWYGAHGWNDSLVPPTDVRTYGNIKASIPEQDNYNAAITQIGLNLHIDYADQAAPAAPTAEDANIKDNSITLTAIENAEYKRGDGEWQESPTFTGLEPNQAYTFYARLKADDNHNASPSSTGTSITTRKAMLENASVTITGTYTYTGAAIVPEAGNVEVVLNGTKIDSDQYTISASNNINAGVGKATLTVTATETGNYSGSVSSTFTIKQADLTVKANDQTITYGESITTGTDQVTATGLASGDTLESVTLEASTANVPGGNITPSGAVIKSGGEDVTANYNITYQPGTLTISYMNAPGLQYNGSDKKEYYNRDVAVTAVPADSHTYTVSDTLGGDYEASYTISAQESTVTKTLYFKDEAGHMSDGVEVTVKFDLTPPTGEIAVGAKWWQNVLHFLSFGNYAAKEYTVTIKAEDKNGSGISKIEYAIVTGSSQYTDVGALTSAVQESEWKEYNGSNRPAVSADTSQYVVYARLTDNVGNVTYISTDGILLDSTAPTVGGLAVPEETKKDVTAGVTFTVSEAADYYYVVLPQGSAAPSAEDIIVTCGGTLPEGGTGTDIAGIVDSGKGAVSADTPGVSVEAENLQPYTEYIVYVTAIDRAVDITNSAEGTPAGNIADVVNTGFTTKKTLPVITKAPAVAGTYGQSVGEMTVTGGRAQAGSTVLAGTWAVSDADKNEKPSAGTSEVTVIFTPGNANYDSVSVQASLTVSPRNLNEAGVTVSEVAGNYTYTGSEIKPPVAAGTGTPTSGISISDSGAVLTANDFTVSYSNNKDAGTASVTITGKGNYTGSVTKTFTIGKAPGREVPDVSGSYTDNGQTYTYTVTPTEGAVYRMGNDGKWQEGNVFEGITPGTSVTFYAMMPEDKNHKEGTPKYITVDFPKLTPAAPALTYKADRTNPADVKITITPVSGAEYSFDDGKTWTESNEQGGFTTSDTVTLAIRLKGTDTHNQSPAQTVTVNLAKEDREAPPAFSLKVEANGETDYTVTIPSTEGCEYSFDGVTWSEVNVKTGISVGETVTGYKRYKETDDYNASSAVSAKETMPKFTVKTPVISPAGGSYSGSVSVTITCGSNDAEIYYTTDGSTPGRGSARYTGAFTVTVPATVKAVAIKDGLDDSAVATASYTKKDGGGSGGNGGGNGNSGGNENNSGSGGNDEGQGSGGNGSTNPSNGNTTSQPSVTQPTDTNANPGNGANPGTGTTPVNPGNGNTSRPGAGSGSGTGTPAQGTKQPFIKGEDGRTGWDVIRAEEEQAQEGSTINVDMNGSVVVPGDIFDSIKGKDITITFDMGDGILWSVDGKGITADKAGDIDFSVKTETNAIPVDVVNNVTGENYSIQISLAHEGDFGFTAVLSIGLGKENAGYTASLYYYNESTGGLEYICSDEVAEDGTVSLAFTHASDYVIAIDGEEESGAAEPAQTEGTNGEAGDGTAENSGVPENQGTGQTGEVWWIIIVILLLAAAIGAGVFVAVKKKEKDENGMQ